MRGTTFLVELPPPFGGVTVKNQLVIDRVVCSSDIVKIVDFCLIKRSPLAAGKVFLSMIGAFLRKDCIVYGFGSHKRLKAALLIQQFLGGTKSLSKTVNLVMGGKLQEYIKADKQLGELLKKISTNLVETAGMKDAFVEEGIQNTGIFPNARPSDKTIKPNGGAEVLRCVFFSRIGQDKGVDYILEELANVDGITLDFYGHVDSEFQEEFDSFVRNCDYCVYHGVFDATKEGVYQELNKYDVLLLPTRWKDEGVPGILVEAKMAGIVPVVSDCNFNSEIVINNTEGIILPNMEKGSLKECILYLQSNMAEVDKLKSGSYESKSRYDIGEYVNSLRKMFGLSQNE